MWQRYVGTVEAGLFTVLIIIEVIAGIVSGIVNYLTLSNAVEEDISQHEEYRT